MNQKGDGLDGVGKSDKDDQNRSPALSAGDPTNSPALERFLTSLQLSYAAWHDGESYDLAALQELQGEELARVQSMLLERKQAGWREVEALGVIGSKEAQRALRECLQSANLEVRLTAARLLKEKGLIPSVEPVLVETLSEAKIGDGLSLALALARDYPSEGVKQKLWECTLDGSPEIRMFCAAVLYQIYGKTTLMYDWGQQALFSRFRSPDRQERLAARAELERLVGLED
jgi:hypothetical protein